MKKFSLRLPNCIDFGWGSANNLPSHIKEFGKNALVFTGTKSLFDSGIASNIFSEMKDEGIIYDVVKTDGEPTVEIIDSLITKLRNEYDLTKYDAIVAIGGGSVIDTAKAVSAMIYENGSVENYLEGLGELKLSGHSMPVIAVPSTSGSGSEATYTAVIAKEGSTGFKYSLIHTCLLPKIAIVDPSLTITLPQELMVFCVIESFAQILESYLSRDANTFTDSILLDALSLLIPNMRHAIGEKTNAGVLESLSYASLMSGIGAANSSNTTLNGVVYAIGAFYKIPYGTLCSSVLFPAVFVTLKKIQQLEPESTTAAKYAMVGSIISQMAYDEYKHPVLHRALSQSLQKMHEEFSLPRLRDLGVEKDNFYKIAIATSQEGNPIYLAETEIIEILELSW